MVLGKLFEIAAVLDGYSRKLLGIRAFNRRVTANDDEGHTILVVGEDNFPFAIPLINKSDVWSFDTDAGRDELLNRRIGRNELNTIQACLAYVDAQFEFAMLDTNNDGIREYAQTLRSDDGMHNGLYWATEEDEVPSPLGELAAKAASDGYTSRTKSSNNNGVFHGYHFKIMTRQGESAVDGERSFIVDGKMIGGFAMIAWPATHGNSGVMTFIVNQAGTIYEKDLGQRTNSLSREINVFDPDMSWSVVNETPFVQ